MQSNSSWHSIIYRSRMNPKIQRNFKVFSPCDAIARPPAEPTISQCVAHPYLEMKGD